MNAERDPEALAVFKDAGAWFRKFGTSWQLYVARWSMAHLLRRDGAVGEARAILLDLKDNGPADTYVDAELAALPS